MSGRKRKVSLIEVVVVALIVVVVCSLLSPVIATGTGGSALAQCQANLRKIGGAVRMYLADWDRTYMTNRLSNQAAGSIPVKEVALATAGQVDQVTHKPIRFCVVGNITHISWVGALYDYIGPVTSKDSPNNVWKCPAASSAQYASSAAITATAAVTYVINYNLLEQPEGESRYDSKLMLLRETDRLMASACRAGAGGVGTAAMTAVTGSTTQPTGSFLCLRDQTMSPTIFGMNRVPHGIGSNILFTDGHVKCFDYSVFGTGSGENIPVWDTAVGRWGNRTLVIYLSR